MTASDAWGAALAEWAIPAEILSGAPVSPWTFPVEVFVQSTRDSFSGPASPTHQLVADSLPPCGTLLDVGAGGGAASIPVLAQGQRLVAVDSDQRMLGTLAGLIPDGVELHTIEGAWPEVARAAGVADVTVCANVAYNVAALGAFVAALTQSARRRVVLEITAVHPQSDMSGLWRRFWGLSRPTRPTYEDAAAVIREVTGAEPSFEAWQTPERFRHRELHDDVSWIRRRLCLPPERDHEIEQALHELELERAPGLGGMVTFWWPGAAREEL